MQAPEADVADAVDRALALAPAGVAKRLLGGESQFLHGELAAAIATLSVLERDATLDARQRRDLYYYLGESHWHDGHHEQGVDYFQRVLELEPRFAPAAIHPAEFALARRDASNARAMIAITGTTYFKSVDFALGKYEQLAAGRDPYALYAQLVLGKPLDLSLAPRAEAAIDRASFDLARAVDAGDEPAARRAIAAVWRYLEAPDHGPVLPQEYYSLAAFGELVIAAGRADDARRLVGFFAIRARDRPSGYPRLQLAAAPLVGERAWVVLDHLTDREAKLAAAAGAELAGDRAHAAELYGELVDDPTPTWDYVERAALLRVLRALGRTKDAAALCADTLKPAMFRYAWFALKRACTPH